MKKTVFLYILLELGTLGFLIMYHRGLSSKIYGLLILFFVVFHSNLWCQVNGYAEVVAISGQSIAVTNVNETDHAFAAGEQIVIMQMQDNVIGGTANNVSFGSLGSIQSAGLYETRGVSYVVRSGGLDSVILSEPLSNTYNINSNASVQLITYPTLDDGGGDFTTTANISAVGWDGNVGGVVAFNVDGILTLNHDIDADASGFRGANANGGGSTGCTPGTYRVTTQNNFADKGEGIYLTTTGNHAAGRAKILNGGGGGNSHNAGGGGGGNYTEGGLGGPGWICSPTAGGIGGIDLSAQISASRVFMGGGGGAGEGNNGASTPGGQGGGIILIKASVLVTTGTCAGRIISTNGETISSGSSNDGAGGAGAAGSVILQIDSFNVLAACDLTVEANGGDGGSVGSGAQHGGGGGGGQGAIIYSSVEPTTNITTTANNGSGGCNNSSSPCTNQASGASGSDGGGVIDNSTGPLPIILLGFDASVEGDIVIIDWSTVSEINNDYFVVERSMDLKYWEFVGNEKGAGNSRKTQPYYLIDNSPLIGTSYYRLKQVDFDGKTTTFLPVSVNFERIGNQPELYPNPVNTLLFIDNTFNSSSIQCTVYSSLGKKYFSKSFNNSNESSFTLELDHLESGVYILQINDGNVEKNMKFIKN